jgi:hypothetical protein
MPGVTGSAAYAQDKQPPTPLADFSEFIGAFFNRVGVQLRGDLLDFSQKLLGKIHDS